MFYERKIKYLDYLVKQERVGGAGFVKLEVRDANCNISITINGLKMSDSFPVKVYIVGDGKEEELCSVDLVQGKGMNRLVAQDAGNIAHTGIAYQDWEAIKIPISADREICGIIGEEKTKGKEISVGQAEEVSEMQAAEEVVKAQEQVEYKPVEEQRDYEEKPEIVDQPSEQMPSPRNIEKKMPLHDNKWKQLWEIYPHVKPFQDEREFLSMGPNDFVILPEKYFRMANNSFLLHGYYNYKHLILKKLEYRGEVRYYIGVPGNFYDREKQVAVMFGFESFEGQEESAQTGDYGYYLMRIEL